MSDWRFLSRDGNVTRWWKYDEATGEETIEEREDAQSLIDLNQKAINNESGNWKGEMHHVAAITPTVYAQIWKQLGGNPMSAELQPAFFKLLNDRDWNKLRVKSGRI